MPPQLAWRWSCTFRSRRAEWTWLRRSLMHYSKLMMVGLVAPTLVVGACNKRPESREGSVRTEATQTADEAAKGQQERADDISRLDKRVAEIEREYTKANEKVVADKKTPTEGLKSELKE